MAFNNGLVHKENKNYALFDKVLMFVGICFIVYAMIANIFFFYNIFYLVWVIAGVIMVLYAYLELRLRVNILLKLPKVLRVIFIVCFVIILTIFTFTTGIIIATGLDDTTNNPDYFLVLGAGLVDDKPTTTLKLRLDKCVEVSKKNKDAKIIVSGGKAKNQNRSEASVMKEYLIDKGVDKERIIMEDKSINTSQNIKFTKKIIGKDKDIAVITNRFHMKRALELGKNNDVEFQATPCDDHLITAPLAYSRESLGLIRAWILGY